MQSNENEDTMNSLIIRKNEILKKDPPNLNDIKDIVNELKKTKANKEKVLEFAEDLRSALFQKSIRIKELDSYIYILKHKGDSLPGTSGNRKKFLTIPTKPDVIKLDYFTILSEVVIALRVEFETLKSYAILRLETDRELKYEPIVVYEVGSLYESAWKALRSKFPETKAISLDEFNDQVASSKDENTSYLVLLIYVEQHIHSEANNERNSKIRTVANSFYEFSNIHLKKIESLTKQDVLLDNHIDKLLEEIDFNSKISLKNAELTYYEELLIKKIFKDNNCHLLEYKMLKGGNSGSKVIEVRPKSSLAPPTMRRYVIKLGKTNSKIKVEKENFKTYIENYDNPSYYSVHHEENAQVEGLRYVYASSDTIGNSYSFAEIVSNPLNKYHSYSKNIIEEVFNSTPFQNWLSTKEISNCRLDKLYNSFIDINRFVTEVSKITNKSESETREAKLYLGLTNVLNRTMELNSKVCHGDLHSENFFKDDHGMVYLIDFGLTSRHHAILDHVSLECSIKYKHIPKYIDPHELREFESSLLNNESFALGFSPSFKNQTLLKYSQIIMAIRNNSASFLNKLNYKEYFISLFLMTCRQVMYSDLNQRFSYDSANILIDKILKED